MPGARVEFESAAPDGAIATVWSSELELVAGETSSVGQQIGPLGIAGTWFFRARLLDAGGRIISEGPTEPAQARVLPLLRVMTYNVHRCGDLGLQLDAIAAVIIEQGADVVGLNEVDHEMPGSGLRREAEELAAATGLTYQYFGCTVGCESWLPGRYGIAILSRFPLSDRLKEFLPNRADGTVGTEGDPEPRVILCGTLAPPASDNPVRFCVTHFTNGSDAEAYATRQHQAARVLEILAPSLDGDGRVILVGDLNETPSGGAVQALHGRLADAWDEAGVGDGLTIESDDPVARFDYVMHGTGFAAAVRAVIPVTTASDHLPVVADLPCR
jgi:endonuclease/exonuclease/phosphatase family metal-dependent hydrolase